MSETPRGITARQFIAWGPLPFGLFGRLPSTALRAGTVLSSGHDFSHAEKERALRCASAPEGRIPSPAKLLTPAVETASMVRIDGTVETVP